jgi:hypothetical protein
MLELGGVASLIDKVNDKVGVRGKLTVENLDSYGAIERELLGQVNGPHTTDPQLLTKQEVGADDNARPDAPFGIAQWGQPTCVLQSSTSTPMTLKHVGH